MSCKFVSCFSYKGGAGRSTLAMNVVPFLAEKLGATKERPFIMVDMDVDSCGLTYLFNLDKSEGIKATNVQAWFNPKFGNIPVVDMDEEEIESAEDHAMCKQLFPIGKFFNVEDKAILCLPAMPGASIGINNYDGGINENLRRFIGMCKEVACGVLFDSAVGNQMTAEWSNSSSNYIMCCMRPTKQFREGTNRFFDEFDKNKRDKNIIIIPNVVPTDELVIKDEEGVDRRYPNYSKKKILEDFEDNKKAGYNNYYLDLLIDDKFGVPKIDRFMWQEGVLKVATPLTALERVALKRYEDIADIIVNN